MMSKLETELTELKKRVEARVARGLSRDKALMLTVMEMGGKISVVKG